MALFTLSAGQVDRIERAHAAARMMADLKSSPPRSQHGHKLPMSAMVGRLASIASLPIIAILFFTPAFDALRGSYVDEIEEHFLTFYAFTTLALLSLPQRRKWDVALASLGVAGICELIQALMGRDLNPSDFFADFLGVALSICPILVGAARQSSTGRQPRSRRRRDKRPSRSAKYISDTSEEGTPHSRT